MPVVSHVPFKQMSCLEWVLTYDFSIYCYPIIECVKFSKHFLENIHMNMVIKTTHNLTCQLIHVQKQEP